MVPDNIAISSSTAIALSNESLSISLPLIPSLRYKPPAPLQLRTHPTPPPPPLQPDNRQLTFKSFKSFKSFEQEGNSPFTTESVPMLA